MPPPDLTARLDDDHTPAWRCVLLACDNNRGEGDALATLIDALHARGVRVCVVDHAAAAMVELAQPGARILILDQPHDADRAGRLIAAARRYFPGVIGAYHVTTADGASRLATFTGDTAPAQEIAAVLRACEHAPHGAGEPPAAVATGPSSRSMVVGATEPGDRDAMPWDVEGNDGIEAPSSWLTPQELRMLLGPPPR